MGFSPRHTHTICFIPENFKLCRFSHLQCHTVSICSVSLPVDLIYMHNIFTAQCLSDSSIILIFGSVVTMSKSHHPQVIEVKIFQNEKVLCKLYDHRNRQQLSTVVPKATFQALQCWTCTSRDELLLQTGNVYFLLVLSGR